MGLLNDVWLGTGPAGALGRELRLGLEPCLGLERQRMEALATAHNSLGEKQVELARFKQERASLVVVPEEHIMCIDVTVENIDANLESLADLEGLINETTHALETVSCPDVAEPGAHSQGRNVVPAPRFPASRVCVCMCVFPFASPHILEVPVAHACGEANETETTSNTTPPYNTLTNTLQTLNRFS